MRIGPVGAVVLLAAGCGGGSDEPLRVFAAASLTDAFGELVGEFEAIEPSADVELVLAGSSTLAAQVADGAPVDVVATADEDTMAEVIDTGRTGSVPQVFATNRLALVVPAGNPVGATGLDDIVDRDLAVAVCAPEVPCGAYASDAIADTGLEPVTFERSVRGVVTKVVLDEVDAGIAYASDVAAEPDLDEIPFPEAEGIVARYPIVAIDDGDLARAFVDFVVSAAGRAILADAGFGPP